MSELSAGRFTLGIGAGLRRGRARRDRPSRAAARASASSGSRRRSSRCARSSTATRSPRPGRTRTSRTIVSRPVPSRRFRSSSAAGRRDVQVAAARHADVLGLTGFSARGGVAATTTLTHFSAERLAERLDWVRTALPRTGPSRSSSRRSCRSSRSPRIGARRRPGARSTSGGRRTSPLDEALESPFLLLGTVGEIAEQLHERTERYGIDTWTVFAGRPFDRVARRSSPPSLAAPRSVGSAACRRSPLGWPAPEPGRPSSTSTPCCCRSGRTCRTSPATRRCRSSGSPCWCSPSTATPRSWCPGSRRRVSSSGPTCSRSARGTRPTTRSRSSPSWSAR